MKFMILNDVNYLIKNRWRWLCLFLLFPLVNLFLDWNTPGSSFDIFNLIMGTNLIFPEVGITEFLCWLFNIFFFLFLMIDIYAKDIENQLSMIFLRMKPKDWFIKKTIIFTIMMMVLKMVQYLLVIGLLFFHKQEIAIPSFLSLFVTDIFYLLFLQYLFLGLYTTGVLLQYKLLGIGSFIVCLAFFPKNIWHLYTAVPWFVLGSLCLQFFCFMLFYKQSKKLLEHI